MLIHDDPGQESRFQAALDVARAVGGHLTCLDVALNHMFVGDPSTGDGAALMLAHEERTEAANKQRLQQRLAAEIIPWGWIDVIGSFESSLEKACGLVDLIVVNSQVDAMGMPDMLGVASGLIVNSGKPVLAVPPTLRSLDLAGSALVAWDGSREASAALSAAVPLLALAESAAVVEIEDGSVQQSAEAAAAYLSRHGIAPRVIMAATDGDLTSTVLLAKANSGKFDYLVMGGFSHSRFAEALVGGVTRRMLLHSEIPLFMAH